MLQLIPKVLQLEVFGKLFSSELNGKFLKGKCEQVFPRDLMPLIGDVNRGLTKALPSWWEEH